MTTYGTPSVKALRAITPDLATAKRAKAILLMPRDELESLPAGAARVAECYHSPSTPDVRMHVLNDLLATHGAEVFHTDRGEPVMYLNAGDTYAPTLVRFRGNYRVACWGDIAERHGAR